MPALRREAVKADLVRCSTRPGPSMKSEAEWLAELSAEVGRRAQEDFEDSISHYTQACQSPIERVMAAALLVEQIEGITPLIVLSGGRRQPFESLMRHSD